MDEKIATYLELEILKDIYDKVKNKSLEKYIEKKRIIEQCNDVQDKLFSSIENTELYKILTPKMTLQEKRLKCFTTILEKEYEYNYIQNKEDQLCIEKYFLEKKLLVNYNIPSNSHL